ncbi:hypothetical protein IT398_01235 [Candidatus Nomurabacteria bacterium]|nr:hypothetical protein [Candidatus Nomurabacteria bacterium]
MRKKLLIVLLFGGILFSNTSLALAQSQSVNTFEVTRLVEIIQRIVELISKISLRPAVNQQPAVVRRPTPTSLSGLASGSQLATNPASQTTVSLSSPAPLVPPTISGVSPSAGGPHETITLSGTGFTPTGNTVYTGYGEVVRPSSDGRTITFDFTVPGFPSNTTLLKQHGFPRLPFGFYVRNANGLTAEPGRFFLQL